MIARLKCVVKYFFHNFFQYKIQTAGCMCTGGVFVSMFCWFLAILRHLCCITVNHFLFLYRKIIMWYVVSFPVSLSFTLLPGTVQKLLINQISIRIVCTHFLYRRPLHFLAKNPVFAQFKRYLFSVVSHKFHKGNPFIIPATINNRILFFVQWKIVYRNRLAPTKKIIYIFSPK